MTSPDISGSAPLVWHPDVPDTAASRTPQGYLTAAELSPSAAASVPWRGLVASACADDRMATAASAARLVAAHPDMADPRDAAANMFGGLTGITDVTLTAGVAQWGADFIVDVRGFSGLKTSIASALAKLAGGQMLMLFDHSDNKTEGLDADLSHADDIKVTGCKYGTYLQPIAEMVTTNGLVVASGSASHVYAFGDTQEVTRRMERVLGATEAVGGHYAAQAAPNPTFAVTHADLQAQENRGLLTMIVGGSHAPHNKTAYIESYDLNHVGSPNQAAATCGPRYRGDVGVVIKTLVMSELKKYGIDPALFASAALLRANATCAALANGDPHQIRRGVLGNPPAAIQELRGVAKTQS